MFKDIDEIMSLVVDSQNIILDDELSVLIEKYNNSELSIESLDLVAAAIKPNYERFLDKFGNV